jgi:hypothetical protein
MSNADPAANRAPCRPVRVVEAINLSAEPSRAERWPMVHTPHPAGRLRRWPIGTGENDERWPPARSELDGPIPPVRDSNGSLRWHQAE